MADQTRTTAKEGRTHAGQWRHPALFSFGYLPVPSLFLQEYSQFHPYPLSHGEALLVLHLMDFKWDESAPFPSYGRLSRRMGVSVKMVRRYAIALERKGYLRRVVRKGRTNLFDLSPLFDRLKRAVEPSMFDEDNE